MLFFFTIDSAVSDVGLPEEEEIVFRTPYYLENFRTIISDVLSYEDNAKLFNDEDRKFIDIFKELTGNFV